MSTLVAHDGSGAAEVLACDPDALEEVAAGLRRLAAELEATAMTVAEPGPAGWSGLAAIEQARCRASTGAAVGRTREPVGRAAACLDLLAGTAREQAVVVRRHQRLAEEVDLARARLAASGALSDADALVRAARLRELEEESRWHRRAVAAAVEAFQEVRRWVTRLLEELRASLSELALNLAVVVGAVSRVTRSAGQVLAVEAIADAGRRLRRVGDQEAPRTRHQMDERLKKNVARFRSPKPSETLPVGKMPFGAAVRHFGRLVPVVALADAGYTLWTGGGYDGWRGGVTRGLAAAGVVGVGLVVFLPITAPAAVVGAGAMAVYGAWMTGNWIYDNRHRLGRLASRGWSGARRVGGRAWTGTRDAAGRAWTGGTDLARRARDRVGSGLSRLRDRVRRDRGRPTQPEQPVTPPVAPGTAPPVGSTA